MAEARERDPLARVTVLVGHVLLRPYLRRMLAARSAGQINVRMLQPHQLAAELAAGRVHAAKPRLTTQARRLLVREVAATASGYFAPVATRVGFASALGRMFRDVELGGFTAESFTGAARQAAAGSGDKLSELAELYARYAGRRGRFLTPADFFASADASRCEGPLLVYGLMEPREAVLALIESIARVVPVTVFEARRDGITNAGADALRDRLGAPPAAATAPAADARGAAGDGLARKIFAPDGEVIAAGGAVRLVSAPDTVREVWEAARACLGWAREGLTFHEMAVVYRQRDPYAALIDEIFAAAGIETYLHDGRMLATHPLGRRLLALLELAAGGTFPRAGVMEFLTETRISRGVFAAYERFRPSEWETYSREAGIIEGAGQWEQRLERLAGEKRQMAKLENFEWQEAHADRIEVFRRFSADFFAALGQRAEEATWAEHLAYTRDIATAYAAGTEPLLDALNDLRMLAPVRERVSFEGFCRAVRDDLESRDASPVLGEPVREFGRRGVAVMDASSLRHLRFRVVQMVGMAERAWPPPPRPDALLLEHERRAINAAGAGTLPLRTTPDVEPVAFWLGLQAARERLTVSYARAEAGSSAKHLPSYFFRAVADALEGRSLSMRELDGSRHVERFGAARLAPDAIGDAISTAEYDRGLVRSWVAGDERAGVDALVRDAPAFGRAMAARRDRWSAALTPFDGVMSSEEARAAALAASDFARGRAVSPSRLETYATCPYRYFLRYALRIEPVEEPEAIERINALERGSLVHAALERFLRRIGRGDPPGAARRGEHVAILLEVARAEEAEREERGVTGRPLVWAMDKRQIEEDLVRWYDAEVKASGDGLLPGAFEASFGPISYGLGEADEEISTREPLTIDARGRALTFQGRIDRVDWDAARSRFRVIDYKTGSVREKSAFDKGRAMQLPIYLLAAAAALELPVGQGEAQYFYVSSKGRFKRKTVSGGDLVARGDELGQVLTTIAEGVDTGMFAPNPDKNKFNCTWCDYKDVCDARIDGIMERKQGDPRGAAYAAMGGIA